MKEKTLDKDTIVAYHSFVQQRIKNELNGLSMGPAWLPCRMALLLTILSVILNTIGFLLIGLRSRHVYLIDWWAQFTGPFFVVMGLIAASGAVYLVIIAKRKSNKYRSELFFRPIGDFGVAVVHKSNLQFEQETKPELKSGTNPNHVVLPNSQAYSERKHRDGHDNRAYDRRDDRRDRQHDHERHGGRDNRERDDRGRRDAQGRKSHDDRRRDPEEEERRRRDRKEREARGEIDPREKEYRERRAREMRERDNRERDGRPPRPNTEKPHREREPRGEGQQQGGRNAGRGAPKLPVDASGFVPADRIILDADFGRPAETSSRASESEL